MEKSDKRRCEENKDWCVGDRSKESLKRDRKGMTYKTEPNTTKKILLPEMGVGIECFPTKEKSR